jgi:MFS family permease
MFTSEQKKIIALASLGGALEFYDFIIFVFFAKVIGDLFFPAANEIASLMGVLAVFAIGYLVRPLGGFIFGHLGDKFGRKRTFVITVFLMAVPTFLMGLLPTYHQAGLTATVLLVVLRLLQGLSVGGEIPGAIVFVMETVVERHRGFATGLVFFGINTGMLVGSLFSSLIHDFLTQQQVLSWGWRLPFLLGGLLGFLSYYLRKRLHETPIFQQLLQREQLVRWPLKQALTLYPVKVFQGALITAMQAVLVALMFLFLPTYLANFFHFPLGPLLTLNTINILVFNFPILFTSYLSDRVGRKKIIFVGLVFFICFPYWLFSLFYYHEMALVVIVTTLCGFLASCITGCFSCMMAELFPTAVRYSGTAICYNLGFGIVGGLTPLIATSLISWSHNPLAPTWWLMFIAAASFITLLFMRETYRESLT